MADGDDPADGAGLAVRDPPVDGMVPAPEAPAATGSCAPAAPDRPPGGCPVAWELCPPDGLAGAGWAAHCVNGACGPPVIAMTTEPRQTASAAAAPRPANRMTRWRRPDGSANTGPDSTTGVYRSVAF